MSGETRDLVGCFSLLLEHEFFFSMNFNTRASLAIIFIIPVLFCIVFKHETINTIRVLAVFYLCYRS